MHDESNESKIDVRIIVSNLEIAEIISKAVNNIQLERDFNIVVSSGVGLFKPPRWANFLIDILSISSFSIIGSERL